MVRGRESEIGDTRISPNGYHYTKTEDGWRLTHHIVAERDILGRPLNPDERVRFKSKDKMNLKPDNIEVILQGKSSLRRRKAQLEARIQELQAELKAINAELEANVPR